MCSTVITLAHALRRVMAFPKHPQQIGITDERRVKNDEYNFIVSRLTGAHLLVGGVGGVTGSVPNRCGVNARDLPEDAFSTPKTSETKLRGFEVFRKRPHQGCPKHGVIMGNRHRKLASGEGILCRG